jgi:hypothetical protein
VKASSFILQQEIFLFDSMDDGEAQTFIFSAQTFMFSTALAVAILAQASSALCFSHLLFNGAEEEKNVPVSDGNDEDFLSSLNVGMPHEALRKWRKAHPTRACQGLGCIRKILNATPGKDKCPDQREWVAHRDPDDHQEWFYALFLLPTNGRPTQPLAGTSKEANLTKVFCQKEKREMEHYTNIHRMRFLAEIHPLVDKVVTDKDHKGKDPSRFDTKGRCTKYHQSPFDMKVHLAESDAYMTVGCTVNNVAAHLLCMHWTPSRRCSRADSAILEIVFYDIVEAGGETEGIPSSSSGAQSSQVPEVKATIPMPKRLPPPPPQPEWVRIQKPKRPPPQPASPQALIGASGGCPERSRSLQSVLSERKKRDGTLHKHPSDAIPSGNPSPRRQSG